MNATVALVVWPLLGLAVQGVAAMFFLNLVGKGRLFSRPLWRFRFFAPMIGYTRLITSRTRLAQIGAMTVIYIPLLWLWVFEIGSNYLTPIFWALFISLYLDDYVTGDDERWNGIKDFFRRKRALQSVTE